MRWQGVCLLLAVKFNEVPKDTRLDAMQAGVEAVQANDASLFLATQDSNHHLVCPPPHPLVTHPFLDPSVRLLNHLGCRGVCADSCVSG